MMQGVTSLSTILILSVASFFSVAAAADLRETAPGATAGDLRNEVVAAQAATGKRLFRHQGFGAFSEGQVGNAGANLYVTRQGAVRTINVWDYNQDGSTDILVSNDHNHVDNSDLLIYLNPPGQGFRNLFPAFPEMAPLLRTVRWLRDTPQAIVMLPTLGGGRCVVADLNRDGWSDIAFCNFVHGWHGRHFEALIYWGGAEGYSETRRTSLPTLTAKGIAAGDLNGDGWPDLVLANAGYEYPVKGTADEDGESYVYWGGAAGFSPERRLSLPTRKAADVALAELNGDGHPDLVFANLAAAEPYLYIYWGSEQGPAADHKLCLETKAPTSLYLNDLDGDGRTDILVGHAGAIPAEIFYNRDGGFVRNELSAKWVTGADAADLNGDGFVDLVLAVEISYQEGKELTAVAIPGMPAQGALQLGESSSYFSASMVYWGSAAGFSDQQRTKLPTVGPQAVKIADLDGDGYQDLLFANRQDGKSFDVPSYIYWGSAEGYAPYQRTELQGFGAMDVEVVDANHDGTKDIVLVNRLSGKTGETLNSMIYWGNPKGYFAPGFSTKLPAIAPMGNASADLNHDGYPDIVFCNQGSDAYVYWGSANGYSPAERTELPVHGYVCSIADVNRDGYLDLVFSGKAPGTEANVIIFWGDKKGFSANRRHLVALGGISAESNIGDVDGDGYLDLLIAMESSLVILKGGPAGYSKENSIILPERQAPTAAGADPGAAGEPQMKAEAAPSYATQTPQVADLNGDGRLDIFQCNYQRNRKGVVPSFIYWNSPQGLTYDNRTELVTMGCGYASIADLNNDGALDIVTAHYNTGSQRSLPCYIYWGSTDGTYSEGKRSELPGESVYGLFIADLDQNGFKDVVLLNHSKDFDHAYGSFIYWGSGAGFSAKKRSMLPTFGSHLSRVIDLGNIGNRRFEETYTSSPVRIHSHAKSLALRWRADCPLGSTLQFQVRFAGSKEGLSTSAWTGPAGADSYYARSGQPVDAPLEGAAWLQYRAVFRSPDGSNYPVLHEVSGYGTER
jgi:hypothetical protein